MVSIVWFSIFIAANRFNVFLWHRGIPIFFSKPTNKVETIRPGFPWEFLLPLPMTMGCLSLLVVHLRFSRPINGTSEHWFQERPRIRASCRDSLYQPYWLRFSLVVWKPALYHSALRECQSLGDRANTIWEILGVLNAYGLPCKFHCSEIVFHLDF